MATRNPQRSSAAGSGLAVIVLDSNIIIYIANGKLRRADFDARKLACSVVAKIETLGFHDITMQEVIEIGQMLDNMAILPMTDSTVSAAIRLRQQRKMGLGDAITAATAIEHNCELWTANEKDFAHIKDLRVHNPLKK